MVALLIVNIPGGLCSTLGETLTWSSLTLGRGRLTRLACA